MANVQYWSASWVSTEGNDMSPGDVHVWSLAGCNFGDAIAATASPISGGGRQLAVQNVRMDASDGWTFICDVANVGSSDIVGYTVGWAITNQ